MIALGSGGEGNPDWSMVMRRNAAEAKGRGII